MIDVYKPHRWWLHVSPGIAHREGWKAEIAQEGEQIQRSDSLTYTDNWNLVGYIVTKPFAYYATTINLMS